MKNPEKIFSSNPLFIATPEQMRELGASLASCLEPRDVIGLVGDLGAGKTHLVQGILRGLGSEEQAVSPTFSLVNEYEGENFPVAHFDFYRMTNPIEALSLGWDDYLASPCVLLVEWADRFDGELMPSNTIWIVIRYGENNGRLASYVSC